MRKVGDGLGEPLERLILDFYNTDGEQNGDGEAEQERQEGEQKRIAQQPPEVDGIHELIKPPQAHPFPAEHSLPRHEIAEGQQHARHGNIHEDDVIQKNG